MQNGVDFFVAALSKQKEVDVPAAVDNYNKAFACAENIKDYDVQCIAAACRRFLYYYNNGTRVGNTMDRNGELHILNRLGERGAGVIFDVGANIGYWALAAAGANPAATIHSFEIFPETHALLAANTAGRDLIVANAFGLSDRDGVIEVQSADGVDSAHFSAVTHFENGRRATCPVMRGDRYVAEAGIDRVDFLKIDVEGGEYDVLTGFSDTLARGAIDLIQFEYGPASLDSRKLLKDYCDLLVGHGYAVGRLHKAGANFKNYSVLDDENFINANFIACRKERPDLLGAVALR